MNLIKAHAYNSQMLVTWYQGDMHSFYAIGRRSNVLNVTRNITAIVLNNMQYLRTPSFADVVRVGVHACH